MWRFFSAKDSLSGGEGISVPAKGHPKTKKKSIRQIASEVGEREKVIAKVNVGWRG